MTDLILLMIHIVGATVGLLSGFLAMLLRKGSGLHGAAGTVFFVSMLAMSSSAAGLAAFLRPNMLNVVVGLLTLYLVSTAWRAARAREVGTALFDRAALLWVLAVGSVGILFGFEAANRPTGSKNGMPAAIYFVFGTVALLHGAADLRMIVGGGVSGTRRVARHLWRMSFALLIATLSFYPGQARLFPQWLRDTKLLLVPHLLLVGAIVVHLIGARRRRRMEPNDAAGPPSGDLLAQSGVGS